MSAVVSPLPAAAVARCAKRLTPPRHPNPLRSAPCRPLVLAAGRGFGTSWARREARPAATSGTGLLSFEAATEKLSEVEGWEIYTDTEGRMRLKRKWKVRSFPAGLAMFGRMGEVAEELKHHPDLHLEGWNKVTVEIWSHDTGGLTERDFGLAARLSAVAVDDLLWKPKKSK